LTSTFSLHDIASWRGFDEDRLDDEEFPPWEIAEAVSFLEGRCGLGDPLPGVAVENHGELFAVWRGAVEAGTLVAPFHVTHVDAHADLGLGEASHRYLLTELLYAEPENRRHPRAGHDGLTDGTYLAFAIACRWVAKIEYVFPPRGGDDLHGPADGDQHAVVVEQDGIGLRAHGRLIPTQTSLCLLSV
jgi:UPF0489 domain